MQSLHQSIIRILSSFWTYRLIEFNENIEKLTCREIRVITKLPNSEQCYKGKVKTHKYINRQNQSTTENCENRNDPDLVQAFLKKWWVESDFKVPNFPFHYGSKLPAVTITVFITILEQNSCQSSTKSSEVNVKQNFTSHIDKNIFF